MNGMNGMGAVQGLPAAAARQAALRAEASSEQAPPPRGRGWGMTVGVALVALSSALLTAGLSGCAQPGQVAAEPPMREAADWLPGEGAGGVAAELAPAWWRHWGDARLDALVQQALDGDPDLQAATARVRAAQAQADAVMGLSDPQAQLGADATLQRFSEVGLVPPPYAGSVRSTGQVSVSASWSPDLSGRLQAEWQAALGQARAQALSVSAARNALSSAVVQQYVALAQVLDEAALLRQEQAVQRQAVALVQQRVDAGLDGATALQQAQRPLAEAHVQAERLAGQAQRLRIQLAVLTGQGPDALASLTPQLSVLQAARLPLHLGADLLGRRADVQAARWQVESARHALRAARAQYYPDINLSAAVGLNALGLNRLLDLGARQASIGPALRLPLFDGGRLDAQQAARNAERDAAIARYNAAVSLAVREAADALAGVQAVDRQLKAQRALQDNLAASRRTAAERHAAGLSGRLPVLAAEGAELALQHQRLALLAGGLQAQAQLAQALGGGWTEPSR